MNSPKGVQQDLLGKGITDLDRKSMRATLKASYQRMRDYDYTTEVQPLDEGHQLIRIPTITPNERKMVQVQG